MFESQFTATDGLVAMNSIPQPVCDLILRDP